MKRIAIVQSNYIPWKGYFDLIDLCDEFVILDTQYTTRDWRNRNRIKTKDGVQWLSVPVDGYGWVSEVRIQGDLQKHINALQCAYGKAPFFRDFFPQIRKIYETGYEYLADLNKRLMEHVCELFQISTPILESYQYPTNTTRTQRLVDICKQSGATHYVSGPKAKNYLDERLFGDIKVEWMEYSYPEYPQINGPFFHEVTILDLLFNCGPDLDLMRTNADIRRK